MPLACSARFLSWGVFSLALAFDLTLSALVIEHIHEGIGTTYFPGGYIDIQEIFNRKGVGVETVLTRFYFSKYDQIE
jgi:hypothetical protein